MASTSKYLYYDWLYLRRIFDAGAIFFDKNIFHALQFYMFLYQHANDAFKAVFYITQQLL